VKPPRVGSGMLIGAALTDDIRRFFTGLGG
jgi:hypothetical protein